MQNPLIVLPHARVKSETQRFTPLDGPDVLQKNHATDAHAVGYYFPNGDKCPRLKLGSLSKLIEEGREPVLGWVFVDVDNDDHRRWTPDEAEYHWQTLRQNPALESAGFYGTRGGYRLVFSLAEPLPVSVGSSYIEQFYLHLKAAGVPVDPHCVARWNTLFRLPRVTRDGEALQSFVDLSQMRPTQWAAPLPLRSHVAPKTSTQAQKERPELRPLNSLGWSTLANCGPTLSDKIELLREGQPIAKKGSRQSTMFKVASAIIGKLELDDADLVYQALAPSVISSAREGSKVTLDELWNRCCYLVEIDKSKRKAREEVKEIVQSAQPPIVYHGGAYHIYNTIDKTYRPPVNGPAICQALEQWTKIEGLETRTKHNKPRALAEYLADYGRQAVEVVVEMGRKQSIFQPEINGGTLLDGCCVMVDVPAQRDEDVEAWLKYFAGDYHDKLLDWIATATHLDLPTCALYVESPPGVGKGMFASGMASLWGCGATSYADAVGKFNSALTRNPVVLVDEMSQSFDGGDGFSAGFRTLIGESSRQLRRKNMPSSTLRGCPRLIIAANNANALKLNEDLGREDLLAIAERVLHIKTDESPRDYINFMGGREFTAGWVLDKQGRPGKIARHAKYLAQTRKVKKGSRFLVQGEIADWHRDLMGNSGLPGATLAALAHFIDRSRPIEGIEISGRFIYVNVPALRGQWGVLMGDNPPREGALAKALKTLASGHQVRRNFSGSRLRCYRLELSDVIRRGESLQIGDVEKFEQLLNTSPDQYDDEYPDA